MTHRGRMDVINTSGSGGRGNPIKSHNIPTTFQSKVLSVPKGGTSRQVKTQGDIRRGNRHFVRSSFFSVSFD